MSIPLDGHSKSNVTPYMHILACHVPTQMRLYGSIKVFSGQGNPYIHCTSTIKIITGVEKNNDVARRSYLSSNHMDAPKDVLESEARKEMLYEYKRQKRRYTKENMTYWNDDIFAKRRKLY